MHKHEPKRNFNLDNSIFHFSNSEGYDWHIYMPDKPYNPKPYLYSLPQQLSVCMLLVDCVLRDSQPFLILLAIIVIWLVFLSSSLSLYFSLCFYFLLFFPPPPSAQCHEPATIFMTLHSNDISCEILIRTTERFSL